MLIVAISLVALGATPKVVSPEWNAVNVKRELATFYADALAAGLRQRGLEVVTSQDITTLLGMERQKALAGCGEEAQSCMAELANALGADATLVVNLVRFDSGAFQGVAKLISSQSGKTLSQAKLDASSEEALRETLETAAGLLADPWVKFVPTSSVKQFWWAPAIAGLAIGAAGGGLLGASAADLEKVKKSNDEAAFQRGPKLEVAGWVAIGVGSAAIVAGVVMLALPKASVVPTATVSQTGASVGIGGQF